MGWFRSSRSSIAWLAFFALACQLVLSFGHVDLGNLGIRVSAAEVDGPAATPPASLPQKDPTGLSRDFCAICANISLASALVVPVSPFVSVPSSFVEMLPRSGAATERATADHVLFSARGPPSA
jgi:hypothetical protein